MAFSYWWHRQVIFLSACLAVCLPVCLSIQLSCLVAGQAASRELYSAEDHLCRGEGGGHFRPRAGGDRGMEGAIKRLWGQSCPGHFSHRQGAVLLCCSGKSDVDGRHHGTDRMGWAQVRQLSGSFLYNLFISQFTVFSSSVKHTGTLAGMGNPVLPGP